MDIIEKLKSLVASGVPKSKIESDLGMPKNCLASVISGKRKLAEKWVGPISGYREGLPLPKDYVNVRDIKVFDPSLKVASELKFSPPKRGKKAFDALPSAVLLMEEFPPCANIAAPVAPKSVTEETGEWVLDFCKRNKINVEAFQLWVEDNYGKKPEKPVKGLKEVKDSGDRSSFSSNLRKAKCGF